MRIFRNESCAFLFLNWGALSCWFCCSHNSVFFGCLWRRGAGSAIAASGRGADVALCPVHETVELVGRPPPALHTGALRGSWGPAALPFHLSPSTNTYIKRCSKLVFSMTLSQPFVRYSSLLPSALTCTAYRFEGRCPQRLPHWLTGACLPGGLWGLSVFWLFSSDFLVLG